MKSNCPIQFSRPLCFIILVFAVIFGCTEEDDEAYNAVDGTVSSQTELKVTKLTAKPIAAVISGSIPTSAKAPATIDFKAWNSLNQSDITEYHWDFKDGYSTSEKNPSHTYRKAGEYNVELSVKNKGGFVDKVTRKLTITGSSTNTTEIEAVISGSIPTTAKAPVKVEFKAWNSKMQSDITEYFWDFKDGTTTSDKNPTHTFTQAGEYEVELTVRKGKLYHTTSRKITVTGTGAASGIEAVISGSIPSSAKAPVQVDFKAWNSKNQDKIKSYFWDFGDGSTTSAKNPSHTFTKAGDFTVKLTVKDAAGKSSSATRKITITGSSSASDIEAVISGSIPSSAKAPVQVDFKAWNSKNQDKIKSYFWDFGDGSTTSAKNPSHTYTKAGDFTVKLTVKDAAGKSSSATRKITITGSSSASGIEAVISGVIPSNATAPIKVDFKAWNSKNQDKIKSYFWDFGDGSTTSSKNPSHTFNQSGVYTVKLTVKDANGYAHSTSIKVSIASKNTSSGGGSTSSGGSSGAGGSGTSSKPAGGTTTQYPSNAVFASSYGFKSGDATAAFEAAINSGSSYVVIDKQSSDWVIRPTRFYNLRNMTIVFEPGVILRAKAGAFKEGDRLFELTNANNITVEGTGATFRMNKSEYTSGEQRHAFEINRSSNITVRGLTLRDSGGAGMMISGGDNQSYSQNINLENITALNNRRDGLTIVSAQDVWVRNSEFSGSSGTKPEAGVVLESDSYSERLVNINFINCKFTNNNSAGIHFSTNKMNGSSRAVSVKVVDCEFRNNAVSPHNGVPATEIYVGDGHGSNIVGGEVRFERIKFNDSRGRLVFTRKAANGFRAVFKDCEARNAVKSTTASPISMEASNERNTLGGIVFDNFYIQYNKSLPFMHINAPSRNGVFEVKDIQGSFSIKETGNNPLKYSGGYKSNKNTNVSISYKHI